MTANQIAYQRHLEDKRSHQANEELAWRSDATVRRGQDKTAATNLMIQQSKENIASADRASRETIAAKDRETTIKMKNADLAYKYSELDQKTWRDKQDVRVADNNVTLRSIEAAADVAESVLPW